MFRRHLRRRNVPLHANRLMHAVIRRVGEFCCSPCNDVGHLFESTSVVRHEAETAAQFENFLDALMGKKLIEHRQAPVSLLGRR